MPLHMTDLTIAITPSSAPSLKRRAPSPEVSDSENVDPNLLDSYGKRKRSAFDDDVSLSKPSRYSTYVVPAPKPRVTATAITPKVDTLQKPTSTPFSAPAAAGRSPTKGKRMGLLQPRKRFAPPTFGTKPASLSITAALNGTLAHKKTKRARTIEESKPNSWFFDIFEESEEQQDYKMNEWTMTQSAIILDISDDESKAKEKSDKGKENIDPNELSSAPLTRSSVTATVARASRKEAMLDEPRTPLGDLNASEFYGEGLDATSVVLVHDEPEVQPEIEQKPELKPELRSEPSSTSADFTFEASEKLPADVVAPNNDIHALLAASAPVWDTLMPEPVQEGGPQPVNVVEADNAFPQSDADAPIDIWESESAKDESEDVSGIVCDAKIDEVQAFALQEL